MPDPDASALPSVEHNALFHAICRRLSEPPFPVTAAELFSLWEQVTVSALVARPDGFDDGPSLGGRLRGAFGRALMTLAAAEGKFSEDAACLFAIGYTDAVSQTLGEEVSRPWALSVSSGQPGQLHVCLHLFGVAALFGDVATQALQMALSGGINTGSLGRHYVPLPFSELRCAYRLPHVENFGTQDSATLMFHAPLVLRRGATTVLTQDTLPQRFTARLRSIARWHDAVLTDSRMEEALAALRWDLSSMSHVEWHRQTSRERREPIRMIGLTGPCRITGDMAVLQKTFSLCAQTGAGSYATFGLGLFL